MCPALTVTYCQDGIRGRVTKSAGRHLSNGGEISVKLLATILITAASMCAADFSIGVTIGSPPPPRVVVVVPPSPAPGYIWVQGYWYPNGNHYKWHDGYWTRPPYEEAHWVEPRHDGERYYHGYWDGEHGRREHDHHWDHDRDRDFDRH